MKAKLLIVIASLLISNLALASGYYNYKGEGSNITVQEQSYQSPLYKKVCSQEYGCGGSYQNNCTQSSGCGGYSNVSCSCADPGCFSGNPCMSSGTCCQAFGNIGSNDFDPICSCAN